MNYSIILWFLAGTVGVFMAIGYPDQQATSRFFFGAGGILFYSGGVYDMFGSIEEQGMRERMEFAQKMGE